MSLSLSNLIVMMRKLEILTPRVNINPSWNNTRTHNWTLDVPTWSTKSPRRLILRLIFLRFLPKSKILSISLLINKLIILFIFLWLLIFIFDNFLLNFQTGINKPIILLISFNIKINRSIGFVSKSIGNDFLNEFHNLRYKLSNSSDNVWRVNFEQPTNVKEILLPILSDFLWSLVFLKSSFNNFVLNVSYVHDLKDIVVEVPGQDLSDGVETQVSLGVSQMGIWVDSWSTNVPSDLLSFLGNELGFLLSPKRIWEFQASDETLVCFLGNDPFLKFIWKHSIIKSSHYEMTLLIIKSCKFWVDLLFELVEF